ncbi:MmgE/PrpD family protein [Ramlibacter sp.]|uniref:MmgE/PrpD family protein n=1 Tax=Ramlibacter sp. TaxID=1917967 RepID=UPI002602D9F4|nr:MmgE/PrpD family protein [Ramlibacter sp.]MDB5955034.1 2-methylcitrate dehydratase [Ramlibacter sp.]
MSAIPSQPTVAERLAGAMADVRETPAALQAVVRSLLVDVAGLCLAARHTDFVRATVQASDDPGECTVIGHAAPRSIAMAALCNGTAAHGEDFDDTYEGGPAHAGAVVVPALLATAERHQLSGADLARGIAVGAEVICRLCPVAPKLVHKAGFHPTAVFGAIGAAVGVGSALRLDAKQLVDAMGVAASMASGIIEYLAEGAWTKRMHPGWAAQAGYRAARLAQAGFLGPRTVFEGEHGFFHAFARTHEGNFAAMLEGLGSRWLAADIAFKPYACGTMAHPYIDCARKLVAQGLAVTEIESIECETAEGIVHRLWEPLASKQNPPNGYAAKFSVPYAIAVGLLRDDAGLPDYEEAVVHDPRVRALAGKVHYVVDPNNPYPRQFTGHLRVTLRNGEVREMRQGHFRGGVAEPLSFDDLLKKFRANCDYGGVAASRADALLALLTELPQAPRVQLQELRCQ